MLGEGNAIVIGCLSLYMTRSVESMSISWRHNHLQCKWVRVWFQFYSVKIWGLVLRFRCIHICIRKYTFGISTITLVISILASYELEAIVKIPKREYGYRRKVSQHIFFSLIFIIDSWPNMLSSDDILRNYNGYLTVLTYISMSFKTS